MWTTVRYNQCNAETDYFLHLKVPIATCNNIEKRIKNHQNLCASLGQSLQRRLWPDWPVSEDETPKLGRFCPNIEPHTCPCISLDHETHKYVQICENFSSKEFKRSPNCGICLNILKIQLWKLNIFRGLYFSYNQYYYSVWILVALSHIWFSYNINIIWNWVSRACLLLPSAVDIPFPNYLFSVSPAHFWYIKCSCDTFSFHTGPVLMLVWVALACPAANTRCNDQCWFLADTLFYFLLTSPLLMSGQCLEKSFGAKIYKKLW